MILTKNFESVSLKNAISEKMHGVVESVTSLMNSYPSVRRSIGVPMS